MNARQPARRVADADADGARQRQQDGKRALVIAATVGEAEARSIKSAQRNQQDRWYKPVEYRISYVDTRQHDYVGDTLR